MKKLPMLIFVMFIRWISKLPTVATGVGEISEKVTYYRLAYSNEQNAKTNASILRSFSSVWTMLTVAKGR